MEFVRRTGLTGVGVSTGFPGVLVGVGTPVVVTLGVTDGVAEGETVGVSVGVTLGTGVLFAAAGPPVPGLSLPHATSANGSTATAAAHFHPRTDMSSTFCSSLPRPDGR
jgi:hypothetical protein